MSRSLRTAPLLLAVGVASIAAPAYGQVDADRATARRLGEAGTAALDAGEYARAEDDFRRADALFHAPTLTLGLARAEAAQKKYVEACESYNRVLLEHATSNDYFRSALMDAEREIGLVEGKRSRVTIRVEGVASSEARVTVDGVALRPEAVGIERFADPGEHTASAVAHGMLKATVTFRLKEGETKRMTLTLSRAAPPVPASTPAMAVPTAALEVNHSPSTMRQVGYVSLAVGGAGLALGAVAGALAIAKHGDISGQCGVANKPPCSSPSETSAVATYHTEGTLADVGFAVLGVFAVTGGILIFAAPRDPHSGAATGANSVPVQPYIGLGRAGLQGTF